MFVIVGHDGLDQLLVDLSVEHLLRLERVIFDSGAHLEVDVVEYPYQFPPCCILAQTGCDRAHGGPDRDHVLHVILLGHILPDQEQGLFASGILDHHQLM